jgi:hypothetical protein
MASFMFPIASGMGLMGCSMDEQGVNWPPPVAEQLANPTPLSVQMDDSTVHVDGKELPMQSGSLQVGAYYYKGNVIELDALELAFDTMFVSGQASGINGYELRHARVTLAQPVVVPVEWTQQGDAGFASLEVDLLLDWSVVAADGTEIELATQHIDGVQVELDIYSAADGTLTAVLDGGKPGVFWSWAGVAAMHDLQFDLRSTRPL